MLACEFAHPLEFSAHAAPPGGLLVGERENKHIWVGAHHGHTFPGASVNGRPRINHFFLIVDRVQIDRRKLGKKQLQNCGSCVMRWVHFTILASCARHAKSGDGILVGMLILTKHIPALFLLASVGAHTHTLAVPAPRERIHPPPIIGEWDLAWGNHQQQSTFRADGTCDSPQFGSGTWRLGDDGSIWFTERGGQARYAMAIDWDTLTGQGAWVCDDGELTGLVDVKLKRRVRAVE